MKSDVSDRWQKTMYDENFAKSTIGSKKFHAIAKKEVTFLMSVLQLELGDTVLDVPCGTGRHSVVFSKRGLKVTGLEINPACLKLARTACKGRDVILKQADMSCLRAYRGKYDAVVNLFSSFGYFSTDEKNEAVLRELVSTLKSGGQIAIHLVNRDWLMRVFKPVDWSESGEVLTLDVRKYDPKTHCNEVQHITVNRRTGMAVVSFHRIRLYSKGEMVAMMKRCGLKNVRVYEDFEGGAFRKFESTHPIYIGKKK